MTAAVHVLCGPARTGKTRRMIERYRVCLADTPGGALWIGPTVRAVEALRERLLAETAALCCPRLCTFQDVVQEIVRINDPEARPLTAAQRRLLAEDVIAELSGGGRLAHFADVADARGFTDGVLGLLTDLQRNAVPPEDFARRAGAGDKQRQCAQLYAHYQGELQRQNLHDSDGTAGRACDLLRAACAVRSMKSAPFSWTASATSRGRSMSFWNCYAGGWRNYGWRCPARRTVSERTCSLGRARRWNGCGGW